MDIQSNTRDISTPISYKRLTFYKPEDSGYHTSFATPSLECSRTPTELQDPSLLMTNICQIKVDCYPITPGEEVRSLNHHYCFNPSSAESTPSFEDPPSASLRRGIKRRYDGSQNEIHSSTVATPTTLIANEVQKLKVNDVKSRTNIESNHEIFVRDKDIFSSSVIHPSTPIKRTCRTNCNLSPFSRRKSPRRVDFAIHSLSCEKQVVKVLPKPQSKDVNCNKLRYKPNQKFDMIKMLYSHEGYCSPSVKKILGFLSKKDVFNFTLVSETWCDIYKNVNTKQKYKDFCETIKSNIENRDKVETPKVDDGNQVRSLKEIQNFNLMPNISHSPTKSPRTIRFNKFTKSASLDTRSQIVCTSCGHPAKVTIESSGEEWGECTNSTCAQQICKLCKYERHPGKRCFQYDLDGPSPSKRKKNVCSVSSGKSRKNLKRLLR